MKDKKRVFAVLVCIILECGILTDYSIPSWATFHSNAGNDGKLEEQDKWPIATNSNASLDKGVIGANDKTGIEGNADLATPSSAISSFSLLNNDFYEGRYEVNTTEGISIVIEDKENILPSDTIIKVDSVPEDIIQKVLDEKIMEQKMPNFSKNAEEISALYLYNISFWSGGQEFVPDKEKIVAIVYAPRKIASGIVNKVRLFQASDEMNEIAYVRTYNSENGDREYKYYLGEGALPILGVLVTNAKNIIPIYTPDDLQKINDDLTGNYILMNDIDLSEKGNWEPIGGSDGHGIFSGSLDGNGYKISNMSIDIQNDDKDKRLYIGLFGRLDGAKIGNLLMDNSNIYVKSAGNVSYVGTIAGWSPVLLGIGESGDSSTFANCVIDNGIIDATLGDLGRVGGIAGYNGYMDVCTTPFVFCKSSVNIVASASELYCGGIAGSGDNVYNCINYGKITANAERRAYVGGLIGTGSDIEESYNQGAIEVTILHEKPTGIYAGISVTSYVGGIIGKQGGVENCYNCGDIYISSSAIDDRDKLARNVNNDIRVGGIAGQADYDIQNCYNIGNINYEMVSRSKNGNVSEIKYVGGILGDCIGQGPIQACYYINSNMEGIGNSKNDLDTSLCRQLSAEEMEVQDNFDGFDFDAIWEMGMNEYLYPILQWQDVEPDDPGISDIPDEQAEFNIVKKEPENGKTNVKASDEFVLTFNKEVSMYWQNYTDKKSVLWIKDYFTDEVVYELTYDMADFYCDGNKVIIKDALKDCRAAKCYVIVSPNLFAHYYRGDNNELKVETFKGITDKDEYTFMMETERTIYTAEFETNGGSNIGKQSFFEGELIRRPSDPVKKGYTFEGWYSDAQCTVKFDFAVRVYEDITIYAKWKEDTVIPETTENNQQEENPPSNRYYSSNWKFEENGQWKCYDSQGKPLVGYHQQLYWEGVTGNWVFDENGNMLTGWVGDRYFNESSNGMKGAEVTDDYVKYYINSRSKDAASQIGGYSYAVQFVDDLDGWTKFGHSLRNWSNTFSAVKGGIQSVLSGEATDWSSAIADAYMKDPVANKSILADIVNEMFSTEAWTDELGDSYKVFKNLTKTERSFVTGPLSKDYWTELESYTIGHIDSDIAEKLNIHDPNGAKGWDAFFKTLKTIGDASEEFQKAVTDYSRYIAYLESLARVAPKEGVLSVAINDLIEQYKNQVAESIASVFVLQRDLIDAWGEVNGIEGYDSMLETGDYWLRDSMVSVVDKLTDLKFGKVDKVIQLVTDNVQEITATDKVVYSAYLRSEAIQALRKAQEKAKSGSTSDMANYKSAFECAKAVTITQYENMVKYYSGNAYQKSDRQKKIAYLQDEISKLKEMNFWDYDEYNPASYSMFQY